MKTTHFRTVSTIRRDNPGLCLAALASLAFCGTADAAGVAWFAPKDGANSNASFSTSTAYTSNFGVAFKTGPAGGYSMDWINIGLNTSTALATVPSGNVSLTIALRNTTNDVAYSAVAGTTEYAVDTVNFTLPNTSNTSFTLGLTSADIPNIASYSMSADTSYSLILYAASVAFGMSRHTGYAQNTTNDYYTVSEGFTALDTFRNNVPNYTNTTNSYPSLMISFGAVPEPSTMLLGAIGVLIPLMGRRRK